MRQSASVCEVASAASSAMSTESRTRAQQVTDCEREDRSKESGLFTNRRRRIEPTIMQRYFLLPGLEPDFRTLRQQRPEGSHAWGEVRSGVGSDKILDKSRTLVVTDLYINFHFHLLHVGGYGVSGFCIFVGGG